MTSTEDEQLLRQAAHGDQASWSALLVQHRDRLRRLVALRMDHRLQGRLDPSDIIQEVYLEASQRLQEYLDHPTMSFFLWLRFLTGQKLVSLHRHHFGMKMRDVNREVRLESLLPEASSATMAHLIADRSPRPSEVAQQLELRQRFQQAFDTLDSADREIIALRNFEQLSNAEAAQALGIQEPAASKRYIRAVRRLRRALQDLPGDWLELTHE